VNEIFFLEYAKDLRTIVIKIEKKFEHTNEARLVSALRGLQNYRLDSPSIIFRYYTKGRQQKYDGYAT
jgi:hypothetical protein